MKAMFITYNQAYNEEIIEVLEQHGQRGYTRWENVEGKGGFNGIPRLGNHAWPELNHALMVMMKDEKVTPILEKLKKIDEQAPELGLRAFVWGVETFI